MVTRFGLYAAPIGQKGISMVDIRDIGEAAAIEATAIDIARLTSLLGRAPRWYRDFAKDAAAGWAKG